jgi:acetylglutamate kinase
MVRKTAFVKASGDIIARKDFLAWVKKIVDVENYFVVICTGGGTQINEAFKAHGFPTGEFGPLGRETKTFAERQFARDVLEKNQEEIQDLLAENQIQATVILPVLDIGSVLCHINGDIFVFAAYLGFDKIYVCTLEERKEKKMEEYKKYPKIEVVSFPKHLEKETSEPQKQKESVKPEKMWLEYFEFKEMKWKG